MTESRVTSQLTTQQSLSAEEEDIIKRARQILYDQKSLESGTQEIKRHLDLSYSIKAYHGQMSSGQKSAPLTVYGQTTNINSRNIKLI